MDLAPPKIANFQWNVCLTALSIRKTKDNQLKGSLSRLGEFLGESMIARVVGISLLGVLCSACSDTDSVDIDEVSSDGLVCPSGISATGYSQELMTGFIEYRQNRKGLQRHLLANQSDWGFQIIERDGRCELNINGQTMFEGSRYSFSEFCGYDLSTGPDGRQTLSNVSCSYR